MKPVALNIHKIPPQYRRCTTGERTIRAYDPHHPENAVTVNIRRLPDNTLLVDVSNKSGKVKVRTNLREPDENAAPAAAP